MKRYMYTDRSLSTNLLLKYIFIFYCNICNHKLSNILINQLCIYLSYKIIEVSSIEQCVYGLTFNEKIVVKTSSYILSIKIRCLVHSISDLNRIKVIIKFYICERYFIDKQVNVRNELRELYFSILQYLIESLYSKRFNFLII